MTQRKPGGHRAVFIAEGNLSREGLGPQKQPLDDGRQLDSREIRFDINLEAILQPTTLTARQSPNR